MLILAVALVAVALLYTGLIVAKSRRQMPVPSDGDPDLRYIFVVPCLDEERVIANTLRSLCDLPPDRTRIVVVDDDSADATAEIVRCFGPRVELLQRRKPRAQLGKGDSLNIAYQYVMDTLDGRLEQTVMGVVDADGRVAPALIPIADRYFSDGDVGGLQFAISIMNRSKGILPRMQDFEFLGFAPLLLRAREHLGSVALGGNGQFVRLSELSKLGREPWTDNLTEDLDMGIRLALHGSRIRFTDETMIDQQGLPDLRRLVRQRTRWVQGHLTCWRLIPQIWRSDLPNKTFLDFLYLLLAPGLMLLSSITFAVAPILLAWTLLSSPTSWSTPSVWMFLAAVYLLMFGPGLVYGVGYAARRPDVGLPKALAIAHLMPLYTYVWYVASWRALVRILLRRRGWSKTTRVAETPLREVVG
jgi:1,2-diacylglycerol 3-beta-glucosyltransferase